MKKFFLSFAMLSALTFGAMQLVATPQSCNDCANECQDDYYSCYSSGEDERACVADLIECQQDCSYYCN